MPWKIPQFFDTLIAPPSIPRRCEFGDRHRRGPYLTIYTIGGNRCKNNFEKEENLVNMSREEMLEFISEALEEADEYTIEQVYEFLLAVEY